MSSLEEAFWGPYHLFQKNSDSVFRGGWNAELRFRPWKQPVLRFV